MGLPATDRSFSPSSKFYPPQIRVLLHFWRIWITGWAGCALPGLKSISFWGKIRVNSSYGNNAGLCLSDFNPTAVVWG